VRQVLICELHAGAVCEAARGCGCRTDQEVRAFVADMIEGGDLYAPLYACVGEAVGTMCLLCAYAFPNEAIDNAVVAALALRERHGVARKLN
jgi:hypothetical protein